MENITNSQDTKLTWQAPQIQKLTINEDTAGSPSSGTTSDFAGEG